jgi:hypothetical protein
MLPAICLSANWLEPDHPVLLKMNFSRKAVYLLHHGSDANGGFLNFQAHPQRYMRLLSS